MSYLEGYLAKSPYDLAIGSPPLCMQVETRQTLAFRGDGTRSVDRLMARVQRWRMSASIATDTSKRSVTWFEVECIDGRR